MKFFKFFLIFCFFGLLNQALFSEEKFNETNIQNESNHDRIYLDKESIVISEQGLFLICENQMIQLPCLRSDGSGIYINMADYSILFGQWRCRCGEINGEAAKKCWSCGRSKSDQW